MTCSNWLHVDFWNIKLVYMWRQILDPGDAMRCTCAIEGCEMKWHLCQEPIVVDPALHLVCLYALTDKAQITNILLSIDCHIVPVHHVLWQNTQHQGIIMECTTPPRRILALISVKHHAHIELCGYLKIVGQIYTTLMFIS